MTKLEIIEDWLNTFPCSKFYGKKGEPGHCIHEHLDAEDIFRLINPIDGGERI